MPRELFPLLGSALTAFAVAAILPDLIGVDLSGLVAAVVLFVGLGWSIAWLGRC